MALGSSVYKLVFDSNAMEVITPTRKELALSKKIMEETRTSAEKYGDQIDVLDRQLQKGLIDQETYNRAVKQMKNEQLGQIPVVGGLISKFHSMSPATIAAGAGVSILAAEFAAATAIARRLTAAVQEQFKELDELGKSARKLGASVDELFAMGVAADELSGVEFSAFETAVQRMTRRVAEAANGAGEARGAINELGLDANELKLAGPTGALEMFADAFARVPDEGDRLRLAMKLFDSEGAALATMLAGGSEGLKQFRQELVEIGALPSPFDTASIEPMNDALNRTDLLLDGMVRDLAVDVAPAITAMAEEFVEALKPGSALGDDIRAGLAMIPPILGYAGDSAMELLGVMQLIGASSIGAAAEVARLAATIDRAEAFVNPFREANEELQFMASDLARQAAERFSEGLENIDSGMSGTLQDRIREIRDEIAATVKDGTEPLDADFESAKSAAELRDEVDKLTASLQEQVDTVGMTSDELERYKLAQQAAAAGVEVDLGGIEALQRILEEERAMIALKKEREDAERLAAGAIDKTTQALREQLETIRMSKDEATRHKLGVGDDSEIAQIQELIAAEQELIDVEKKAQDERDKLTKDLDSYTKQLERQIATVGMSADEAKLWELAERGATEAELERIKALQDEAAAHEELKRASSGAFDAMEAGSREAQEALLRARERELAKRSLPHSTIDTKPEPAAGTFSEPPLFPEMPVSLPEAPASFGILSEPIPLPSFEPLAVSVDSSSLSALKQELSDPFTVSVTDDFHESLDELRAELSEPIVIRYRLEGPSLDELERPVIERPAESIGGSAARLGSLGATTGAVTVQPIVQPVAPQPTDNKAILERQLAELKKLVSIEANKPAVTEVTL